MPFFFSSLLPSLLRLPSPKSRNPLLLLLAKGALLTHPITKRQRGSLHLCPARIALRPQAYCHHRPVGMALNRLPPSARGQRRRHAAHGKHRDGGEKTRVRIEAERERVIGRHGAARQIEGYAATWNTSAIVCRPARRRLCNTRQQHRSSKK